MGFYSVLGFLRPAIFIFLLPIYLAELTVEEIGMYGLMMDFALIYNIFASLKINTAMMTNYYDYSDSEDKVREYLSSTYTFSLLIGVVMAVLFYFIGPSLFKLIYNAEQMTFMPYGWTVVIFASITEVNLNYIVYLKNKKNILKYSAVLLTQIISVIAFQVIFIIVLDRGLQGALEGVVIGNLLVTILVVYFEKYIINFNINWSMIKDSLKFSVPLIPYLIIYWFLTRSGKTFLENETDTDTVGIYTLLITIAGLVIFGVEAVVNAIRPFLFEAFKRDDQKDKAQIGLLTKMIINVPLLIVPCIILIGTNISLITDKPSYFVIDQYITFACFVMFVFVWARLFYQQLVFTKRSKWVTALSFVVFIVLIISFHFLIPEFEIWGVLLATLIANLLMAVLFYFAAQKVLHVTFKYGQIIFIPLMIFALIFIIEYIFKINGWSLSMYGIVQFFIVLAAIFILNWNSIADYKQIFGGFKKG